MSAGRECPCPRPLVHGAHTHRWRFTRGWKFSAGMPVGLRSQSGSCWRWHSGQLNETGNKVHRDGRRLSNTWEGFVVITLLTLSSSSLCSAKPRGEVAADGMVSAPVRPREALSPLGHPVVHFPSFWSLVSYFHFVKVCYLQSCSYFCARISAPREWFYTSARWVQWSCMVFMFPVSLKASLASATLTITVGPFMRHEHCPFYTLPVN